MSSLTEQTLLAFQSELEKVAGYADLIARAAPRLKAMGSMGGVGALGGAIAGGGIGAMRGYHQAQEEGATGLTAGLRAAGKGVSGALQGGALGAIAGGAGGALSGRGAGLTAAPGSVGSAARFGQRQVHSLTGMLNPAEIRGVGGGSAPAREALSNLHHQAAAAAMRPGKAFSDFAPQIQKARQGVDAASKAEGMGLTSIPGYIGSLKEHGVGETLRAGWKHERASVSPALTALTVGLPAAGALSALAQKEQPTGPGKGETVGRNVGGILGGIAGGTMPIVGNLAVASGASAAGAAIGKGIDRLRGRRAVHFGEKLPDPTEQGQHTPTERIMSPAAAGQQNEVGV